MAIFQPGGPERFDHQKTALRRLIDTRGVCALLLDPGLGKTGVVIDYASLMAMKLDQPEIRMMVLAPLAAVDSWVSQTGKFVAEGVPYWAEALGGSIKQRAEALIARSRGELLHHGKSMAIDQKTSGEHARLRVEVLNLDSFASRAAAGSRTMADVMVEAVKRYQPDLIVVDESHRIKGHSSNTSRAIARLTPLTPRRILLTGTVMPHSPMDVYGQWRFLEPYAFGRNGRQATFGGFRDRFAVMGGFQGKQIVRFKNLDEMQEIMSLNSVVARKEDALDLPKTTDIPIRVDLSSAETKAYREMKDGLASQLSSGTLASAANRLAQMMRLRQITSGFITDDQGQLTSLGESKIRVIQSLVHDTLAGEKRIVVFAHFRREIELLVKKLRRSETEVLPITGDTPPDERAHYRKKFGSEDDTRMVMVAQVRTMSLAVNELVSASHAIYASLSQDRADFVQSRDRLDRIGQTRPVTFWYAMAPGSIDEVIYDAHQTRTSMEDALLAHIASA